MGNLERQLTHAQATELVNALPAILGSLNVPAPDADQLLLIRDTLLMQTKRLHLALPVNKLNIHELEIFGGTIGFSLMLLTGSKRVHPLSGQVETLLDELVIETPFDDEDWSQYLTGALEAWLHIHSNIWNSHGVNTATEKEIQAMARDLDSKLPTANLANSEARNVVFGLYSEVAAKHSRMGAIQLAQFTSKVMAYLYELQTPQSVDVSATIARFVD